MTNWNIERCEKCEILGGVKRVPMNETNTSEIDLADINIDEYKTLRTTIAFIIEGVLLPVLASFGIIGESLFIML